MNLRQSRPFGPQRLAALTGAALLATSTLAACSGTTGAAQLGASCDDFQKDTAVTQTADARVGDELSIVLCSNPSTGFTWEDPVISDPAVLRVTGATYRDPGTELPIVGAAGGQEIRVAATAAGTATLTVGYSRPWEGGEKDVQTYEVTVTVK